MKVMVTGGAGFIGYHVVEELLNKGYEVVVIDNLVTGTKENLHENIKFIQIDLSKPELEDAFVQEKPNYVIHLAAQASVTKSMNDPYLDFYTNTVGTVKMMFLSKKYNVKKFVFASTAAVYGEPSYLPIDEEHTINPVSYYSLSKSLAEKYIEFNKEFNSCILRFSNVYGPRQNANSEAGVISIFINRLYGGEDISIYDGSQTRDFIYVKDVAVACRFAMESDRRGVINISSCTETTITNLYYQITELTGKIQTPVIKAKRKGEIDKSILDNKKARKELEWTMQYSLREGLKETVDYIQRNFSMPN